MRIGQHDVAQLTDDQLRFLVVVLMGVAGDNPGPIGDLWQRIAYHLSRQVKARRCVLHELEVDLADDGGEGELVEPGADPVGDALRELDVERSEGGEG